MSDFNETEYTPDNNNESNSRTLLFLIFVVVIAILAAVGIYFLFFAPDEGGEGGTPTATPVAEVTQPPAPEDLWTAIQARGTLVVGTSADYPPFAYYNRDFQLDGLDVALIRDLASQLGLQVEIKDIVFDGLGNALQAGQIDVAIAAIARTPERETAVDFTNIYYVSQDATLFRANDPLNDLNNINQFTTRRVGVQRASVYDSWFQEEWVDTGQMPASNLLTYERMDSALTDLREGRIDAVVMDLPPAEMAVEQGGLKIVNTGFRSQSLALAVPKGATAVRDNLNVALQQAQASGRVQQLITQYLGTPPEQILPTPTSPPQTATPLPTATPQPCIDSMTFVADLNLNDYNMTAPPILAPGQPFTKGWRIRNSGTCTWDSRYAFRYAGGNSSLSQMNGQTTAVQGQVAPGATYDMYINMVAPLIPGTYQGFWTMHNGANQTFGDRVWVGIRIPNPATVTPMPTQTPTTDIFFAVDRFQITQGECVTFNWRVQNAREVYFYSSGQAWQNYPVPTEGQRVECPGTTTTYNLRVVKSDGAVEIQQATIYVSPQVNAPNITQFVANPPQITLGQCTTLQWTVEGSVNQVVLTANGQTLWDNAPASGTYQNCPTAAGTVEYGIQANGPGGASRSFSYVTVYEPSTATPVPTQAPELPIINQFAADPSQITAGQCVQISWVTSGGTDRVRTLRNGLIMQDNAPLSGSFQDCPTEVGIITYRLEARNIVGEMVSQDRTVSVAENPDPQNPLANTEWAIIALNESPTINDTLTTMDFDPNGNVSGSAGCNNYTGNYAVNGQSLRFTTVNVGRQVCPDPPGLMEQEQFFTRLLLDIVRFEIAPDSGLLLMYDVDGRELMRAVRR